MSQEFPQSSIICSLIINSLKPVPLIIWGSGGTIPFGMPSMEDLKAELGIVKKGNLEKVLSETKDDEKEFYKQKIFNIINEKDSELRDKINTPMAREILNLFRCFYGAHPQYLNIITTNYDCFLENLFSYYKINFTDGFSGREFSAFEENRFSPKGIINIIKAHGSVRWNEMGRYSYFNESMKAIYPHEDKYKVGYDAPFRDLIRISDMKIKKATSILIIGFGFNDAHLTHEIKTSIQERGCRIVIVAKKITENAKAMVSESRSYILIEENKKDETKFTYKNGMDKIEEVIAPGNYWQLPSFYSLIS